jgi:HAD superfamily hydrolase (TIGR01490 family)
VALAIFDLDNTLLAGDSDYLWGQYLVEREIVNRETYEKANLEFYEDYRAGKLDIERFLMFALKPLAEHEADTLFRWRSDFVERKIKPILLPQAQRLIDRHRDDGDVVVVITATNQFVTEPIVRLYGIEHLIATTPEFVEGRFTGRFVGTPCFREGKVSRLQEWLKQTGAELEGSSCYSASHNDEPLLALVDNPVAVDPDEDLLAIATTRGWPVISLR